MGWKQEMQRREKQAAKDQAAVEVAQFDGYLARITTLHARCSDRWNWRAIAESPSPETPERSSLREHRARDTLALYAPGFFERLFGGAKQKTAELEAAVERARNEDEAEYQRERAVHATQRDAWQAAKQIASGLVAKNPEWFGRALAHAACFQAVEAQETAVTVASAEEEVIVLDVELHDAEVIPREEVKLTSTGKLSTKDMAQGRYWQLYQDHVCSAALRVARETFAVLPVARAIVNVGEKQVNTSTGHRELVTLLTAHFQRSTMSKLNFVALDPSDAMKNFPHRMKFKKTSGFEAVERITTEENWVTT